MKTKNTPGSSGAIVIPTDPGGNWVHQGDEQIAYGCCDQCDQRTIEDSQDENMEALAAVVQE